MRGLWLTWALFVVGCGDNIRLELETNGPIASLSGNNVELCALGTSGSLKCWIDPWSDSPAIDMFGTWSYVAAGNTHSCAIDSSGDLWCWGRNCVGQLRDGSTGHDEPTLIESELVWKQVAVGGGKTCAIDSNDQLYCWGGQDYHQSDCNYATNPIVAVEPQRRWKAISSNWYLVEGVTTDGELIRLPDPVPYEQPWSPRPEVLPGRWSTISSGIQVSCGLRQGDWACIDHDATAYTIVRTTASEIAAVASDYHHCALDAAGVVWCVGRNDSGQVDPYDAREEVPEPRRHEGRFSSVAALQDGTCASNGSGITCWGGLAPND